MKKMFAGLGSFLFAANIATAKTGIVPENEFYLEDDIHHSNGLDETTFHAVIRDFETMFAPIVQQLGARLAITADWQSPVVNAYAERFDNDWQIQLHGGFARRAEITADGFTLLICHELGHHIGGFPFGGGEYWAGSEAQSDYFATQACARHLWRDQHEVNARFRDNAPTIVKTSCDAVWQITTERDLCYRTAVGAKALVDVFEALQSGPGVHFEKPDTSIVTKTLASYPEPQCRLDTYFAGLLCAAPFDYTIIPARSHPSGQTSLGAEMVASKVSCTTANDYHMGLRPACWFAPRLAARPLRSALMLTEVSGNGNGVWDPGETFNVNLPLHNNLVRDLPAGATFSLAATSDDVMTGAPTTYAAIPSAQTSPAHNGINVTLSEQIGCGSVFHLDAHVTTADTPSATELLFVAGSITTAASFDGTTRARIPDNKKEGLILRALVQTSLPLVRARFVIDLKHSFLGDVAITLISPGGRHYVLFNRDAKAGTQFSEEFTADISGEPGNGEWQVQIQDLAFMDFGDVNAWRLSFDTSRCEDGP